MIVVDDGSTDATAALAAAAPAERARRLAGARRPRAGRNAGVAAATGSLLAFTDADCVPEPDWLERGVGALESADLVQGPVRPDPRAVRMPFDRTVWVDGEVALYETANLFCRRSLFDRLGGFEDWLGTGVIGKPLAEDVWFGWRARRLEARIAFEQGALVHHAVFPRRPGEYVAERARRVYFPAIVAKIPELRGELLFAGLFLDRRTAALDLAALGALGAVATRSAVPLALAAPYLAMLARHSRRWGRRAPLSATVELGADLIGGGALLLGSLRSRTPVL